MTPVVVTDLAFFSCGALALWLVRQLATMLRPMRIRCSWCGKVRVSASGQACPGCLESVAREGRAAPEDWPEA